MRTPANVPVTEPKTEHSLPALEPELDLELEFEFDPDEPTTIDPVFVISDEDENEYADENKNASLIPDQAGWVAPIETPSARAPGRAGRASPASPAPCAPAPPTPPAPSQLPARSPASPVPARKPPPPPPPRRATTAPRAPASAPMTVHASPSASSTSIPPE